MRLTVDKALSMSLLKIVQVKDSDILGNEIATLVNEEKPAGSYEFDFNAAELSSGKYFYKLQAVNFVETKKMIFDEVRNFFVCSFLKPLTI